MRLSFRPAQRADVPAVLRLMVDDDLGQTREEPDIALDEQAFDQIQTEGGNQVIVGETADGQIAATYQITFITGLSLRAARRAQVETVRVASAMRGQGLGQQMFADVEVRARAAGCHLVQLTMNTGRRDAHRFYTDLGFEPSHTGFKLYLD